MSVYKYQVKLSYGYLIGNRASCCPILSAIMMVEVFRFCYLILYYDCRPENDPPNSFRSVYTLRRRSAALNAADMTQSPTS